jgi:hypothetical protein
MLTSVSEAAGGTDNGADDKTSGTCGGDAVRVLPTLTRDVAFGCGEIRIKQSSGGGSTSLS